MSEIIEVILLILGMKIATLGSLDISLGAVLGVYLLIELAVGVFNNINDDKFDVDKEMSDYYYGRGDYWRSD
jgi:hypothetical protein